MLTDEDLGLTDINTGLTVRQTISQGQHKLLLNADLYAAMVGLLKLTQQVRSVLTDGEVQSSDDGTTPQPVPTATPATSEASPWSWMDPQIHLTSASGKTQTTHRDVTDYVNVAGGDFNGQVLNESGDARCS